jgi:AraC-like DNA-binding protein
MNRAEKRAEVPEAGDKGSIPGRSRMFPSMPHAGSSAQEFFLKSITVENSCTVVVVSRDHYLAGYMAKILGGSGPVLRARVQDGIVSGVPSDSLVVLGERKLKPQSLIDLPQVLTSPKGFRRFVLCTEPTLSNLRILLHLRPTRCVFLGLHEKTLLIEAVQACAEEDFFEEFYADLERLFRLAPVVRSALKRILQAQPLTPEVAAEVMAAGGTPFPRTLDSIAKCLSCSTSYLSGASRSCGIFLSEILRWTILLRGIHMRHNSKRPWSEISVSFGFRDITGWTKFVKRLVHVPPTMTDAYPVQFWEERFKAEVLAKSEVVLTNYC